VSSADVAKEYEVKGAFLLNLTRFIDWPESAFATRASPLVIGIVGRDPFGKALDESLRGQQVNGHPVVVERFADARSIKTCHLLFISASEKPHLTDILKKVEGRPVLTVSELPNFATTPGGMVRIYINPEHKVRLQVNLDAARAEGLKPSAKLLQVVEVISK
jgi:YfiR/HmsC-like